MTVCHLTQLQQTPTPSRRTDSTCVHETAANIMAKADRDDALDTLVRIYLRHVGKDSNSM